jgi:tRNA threonylcarbamoyladenosine biosynthesis protein TsaE
VATFTSNSAVETEALGREFGLRLEAGAVVALQGELGAGKTQFTKGVVAGLGSDDSVTSPTFTIVHEYRGGRLPIYHFDFFRLEHRERLFQVGLDDYLFGDGVCIIEWADRFADLIPEGASWIRFEVSGPDQRVITVE